MVVAKFVRYCTVDPESIYCADDYMVEEWVSIEMTRGNLWLILDRNDGVTCNTALILILVSIDGCEFL